MEFGILSNTLHDGVVGITPEDISRHIYILGGTGSGKSTLIRSLYKHLECANYTGVLSSSIVYIDVKDEDAKLFLRQCDKRTLNDDKITYLDLNHVNFAVNLLELPSHDPQNRDSVVSRMVGHIIEMFKEFYSQPQTYVQMERILKLLLFYLYANTNNPSIIDLYEIIIRLQRNGKYELQQIFHVYKKISNSEMKQALNSISTLSKDSWLPLLNRFEMFVTDTYLKRKFGVLHTKIDFNKMLLPGHVTIFRISDTETPKHVHNMAIMAIVLKIWFVIQHRASQVKQEQRSLVVLALDEFQKIQDLSIITAILSQSRSYNLGLILSHQNLAQISPDLLETIVGNTATQFYGRVSGIDANKIAKIIEPHFVDKLTDQIATQPDFIFTAKIRPPIGQQQSIPMQFKLDSPPDLILDEDDITQLINKTMNSDSLVQPVFYSAFSQKQEWIKQLSAPYRSKSEWDVILFLQNQTAYLTKIVEGVKSTDRNKTSSMIQSLKAENLIDVVKSTKQGRVIVQEYALSQKAKDYYFPTTFESMGQAKDIGEVAKKAHRYYLNKGFFISMTNQNTQRNNPMSDMIAYDYENNMAIAIEIESISEISSHPEQVRFNMVKWKDLGFVECHMWSKSGAKLNEIKLKLGSEADKVTVFSA